MENLDKDALFSIALQMDLPELINFCKANKYINEKICNNNYIWFNKLKKDFDFVFDDYLNPEDFKKAYKLIYSLLRSRDFTCYSDFSKKAGKIGSIKLFLYVLKRLQQQFSKHTNNLITQDNYYRLFLDYGLKGAVKSENLNIIKYFVEILGEKVKLHHLTAAVKTGNVTVLDYLFSHSKIKNMEDLAIEKKKREWLLNLLK
jgi:hypothetical protein